MLWGTTGSADRPRTRRPRAPPPVCRVSVPAFPKRRPSSLSPSGAPTRSVPATRRFTATTVFRSRSSFHPPSLKATTYAPPPRIRNGSATPTEASGGVRRVASTSERPTRSKRSARRLRRTVSHSLSSSRSPRKRDGNPSTAPSGRVRSVTRRPRLSCERSPRLFHEPASLSDIPRGMPRSVATRPTAATKETQSSGRARRDGVRSTQLPCTLVLYDLAGGSRLKVLSAPGLRGAPLPPAGRSFRFGTLRPGACAPP